MIKTITGNRRNFKDIADALKRTSTDIGTKTKQLTPETRRGYPSSDGFQRSRSNFGQRKFISRSWKRPVGMMACQNCGHCDEDDSEGHEEECDSDDPSACFLSQTVVTEDEYVDVEDQIEQDVLCSFLAAGLDPGEPEVREEIAASAQHELMAFYFRESARERGVPVQNITHGYRPKSELSVETRTR